METIIDVIIAIGLTTILLLFNVGCYFLQISIYELRKNGGSKYGLWIYIYQYRQLRTKIHV